MHWLIYNIIYYIYIIIYIIYINNNNIYNASLYIKEIYKGMIILSDSDYLELFNLRSSHKNSRGKIE